MGKPIFISLTIYNHDVPEKKLITVNANYIVTMFRKADCTHVWFLDVNKGLQVEETPDEIKELIAISARTQ